MPIEADQMPAMPPTTDRHQLLEAVADTPIMSNTQMGVSSPTEVADMKITRMPTWNRFEPHIS